MRAALSSDQVALVEQFCRECTDILDGDGGDQFLTVGVEVVAGIVVVHQAGAPVGVVDASLRNRLEQVLLGLIQEYFARAGDSHRLEAVVGECDQLLCT